VAVHVHQGTKLAGRQVKGHHQIPVILPKRRMDSGASQQAASHGHPDGHQAGNAMIGRLRPIFGALLDDEEREFRQQVLAGPPPLGPGAPPLDRAGDQLSAASRVGGS
jgi:hypothetical protein